MSSRDIDSTSENVLHDWAREPAPAEPEDSMAHEPDEPVDAPDEAAWGTATPTDEAEPQRELVHEADPEIERLLAEEEEIERRIRQQHETPHFRGDDD